MGVFLHYRVAFRVGQGLPHARGGVSDYTDRLAPGEVVFPTLVGVFLLGGSAERAQDRLPHARGGVSKLAVSDSLQITVFPTLVGVFPTVASDN